MHAGHPFWSGIINDNGYRFRAFRPILLNETLNRHSQQEYPARTVFLPLATVEAVDRRSADVATDWLGFAITKPRRGLRIDIADRSWARLDERLALAHLKPDSPLRAVRTVEGWISQHGPCYRRADRGDVCARVAAAARAQAFDEMPDLERLEELCETAHRHWLGLRTDARKVVVDDRRP